MPMETLAAFADHGRMRGETLRQSVEDSQARQALLTEANIDIDEVAVALERDGVRLFAESFALLRTQLAGKLAALSVGGHV